MPAPPFDLPSDDGSRRALAGFAGSKLVVYFYPRAETPGCTTQACDLRDDHARLEAAGYEIVGISPDPPGDLRSFRGNHRLPFVLLSDVDHAVAARYGAWGTKRRYGREYEGIIRSTFLIDEAGVITAAWYNVRAAGHADKIASAIAG
jgi:peroxiredoxin Q/BCP